MTRTNNTVYVLRTCNADMTAHGGFKYPKRGPVEAPDWRDDDQCGGGLHGLPWGVGDVGLLDLSYGAVWQVLRVNVSEGYQHGTGDMLGKCKFRRGTVVYTGTRDGAIAYLDAHGATDKPVVFAHHTSGGGGTSTSGDRGTSTSGYRGTSTSGDEGTSTSGDEGTSTSGDWGTSTSGDRGTSTSGDWGTSTSGDWGTSTSGDGGTSTSGDWGTSTSGDGGTSTSGDWGTSTSGYRGTSTSGDEGTSTSGDRGTLIIKYYDGERYRLAIGYIGEDGLKPNTPYRLNDNHEFEEVPA